MKRVLFVCLGNICRSPAAEAMLRSHAEKAGLSDSIFVTSCGIGDWHLGKQADLRMREAALYRGITIQTKAKVFVPTFLKEFDYIMASDHEVLEYLHRFARTPEEKSKLHLMTAYSEQFPNEDVPDPYYEGAAGFERVLDILNDSCKGLISKIHH